MNFVVEQYAKGKTQGGEKFCGMWTYNSPWNMKLYITHANFSSIELSRLLPEEIRTGWLGEGEKLHQRRFSIP
jgi:hypothetical protein